MIPRPESQIFLKFVIESQFQHQIYSYNLFVIINIFTSNLEETFNESKSNEKKIRQVSLFHQRQQPSSKLKVIV